VIKNPIYTEENPENMQERNFDDLNLDSEEEEEKCHEYYN
jgi:hypothetical protein